MQNYNRDLYYDETDAPWVLPSPNLPTIDACVVYPGTVFLEGTMISEGRGTTRPFELIGAPYVDADALTDYLNALKLPAVYFRPHSFLPTFQKHAGVICHGVQLHVLARRAFAPVITGIAIIKAIHDLYPQGFAWKQPPYEYEYERNPFDVIAGSKKLREQIEGGIAIDEIAASWCADEKKFAEERRPYLLY